LALATKVFSNPIGIEYDDNRRVRLFLKRYNFFLLHPGFYSANKSTIYILMRFSRYVTIPILSIFRKDERIGLLNRLSDPKWYKQHLLSYWYYFKPVS